MSGCLEKAATVIMTALVCSALTTCGVVLLTSGSADSAAGRQAARLRPLSPAELAGAASGEPVVVVGRIDPEMPVAEPKRGLSLYTTEVCSMRYGREGRKQYSWSRDEENLPRFEVRAAGAAAVVERGYKLRRPTFAEAGEDGAGQVRYRGFRPGDAVLVHGIAERGRVTRAVVFGGDHAAYLADLQGTASDNRLLGWSFLAGVPVVITLAVLYIRAYRPPQQPGRSA